MTNELTQKKVQEVISYLYEQGFEKTGNPIIFRKESPGCTERAMVQEHPDGRVVLSIKRLRA